ncbi:unnamed protein product, partial [Mesorhabditis spiculigera]
MISRGLLLKRAGAGYRQVSPYSGLTSEEFMRQPAGVNEPILEYKRGSKERTDLDAELKAMSAKPTDVPLCIGKKKVAGKLDRRQVMPFEHKTTLARFSHATSEQIVEAIEAALSVREKWDQTPLKKRADILLHAADLAATKYRMKLMSSTMLGQGKNIYQGEIDSTCELIDFLRFSAKFALDAEKWQPISIKTSTNKLVLRGLDGFVAAVAPFNFTAIGGNLSAAPAVMGNVVLWKPSDTSVLSNYVVYQILEEAGIPAGVINFLPSDGPTFGNTVTKHPELAAINFTGSVPTFKTLWKNVANNLDFYKTFPKLVGECGGKNFHFIHPSANVDTAVAATARSAWEYSGQKCSACSRVYIPKSMWNSFQEKLAVIHKQIKLGDVRDGSVFMSAVIDDKSFARNKSYVDFAKSGGNGAKVILGGNCDDSKGYFIEPTLIQVESPKNKLIQEEIFGPILTAYVYDDKDVDKTLGSLKDATPFGLTGAVFSGDKDFLYKARDKLRDAVGNLYLNDKSTGAIVSQQPFGGARMSGTNDKAGAPQYMLKWTSPQTIKETHVELPDWRYPSMD